MGRVLLQSVSKRFGDVTALDHLTLEVQDKEFLVLLGPSGCGKSTALRIVAGLDEPTEGFVQIGERVVTNVEAKDRDVAMVFQSYALYPHMSVHRNIEFPLRSRRVPKAERHRLVTEAAEILGLTPLLERKPAHLSGGQRQRVALARAIVRRPEAFLMDEPLSNLDAKLRVQTRAELVELHRRLAATVIYVTHDQIEAMTMGNRIAILNEGVLQQVGPPQEVYDRPANLFVARFIGTPPMNTVEGQVRRDRLEATAIALPGGDLPLPPAVAKMVDRFALENVVVGLRPEHVSLDGDGPIAVTVSVVESLGHERHVFCRLADGQPLIARLPAAAPVPPVETAARLRVDDSHLHLFDPATDRRVEE